MLQKRSNQELVMLLMIFPSRADELVEKLRTIDPLQAAREKIGNRKKKKKADPPRRLTKRRKYRLKHSDLYRKLWE